MRELLLLLLMAFLGFWGCSTKDDYDMLFGDLKKNKSVTGNSEKIKPRRPPPVADSVASDVSPELGNMKIRTLYLSAGKAKRIVKDFQGEDKSVVLMQTDPEEPAGLYFVIYDAQWALQSLPKGTRIDVRYVRSDTLQVYYASFPLPENTGTAPLLFFGITGSHWPDSDVTAVAWEVKVQTGDGYILARLQDDPHGWLNRL